MIDFRSGREPKGTSFDFIQIRIAAPEEIRGPRDSKERERLELQGQRTWWSWGEVTKPETINYRSFKPERDGLFCERIFGPVKDWECHCGKYKRIRYRGVICDRCGVEVTLSKVRRERMGHIELAVPVAHIWFFKTLPSPMGNLLDMTLRDLERVIYYTNYVVIEPGEQEVQDKELLDEDRFLELRAKAKAEGDAAFKADIGAPAVRALLDNGRRSKAIRGRGKRPLKSLSDMLKGKQGRFRQNLLGKRVDYSGRSVIVVGPELRLHQCGLPKAMAVELFKPFIIHKLVEKGIAETVKRAKKIVEKESPEVYEILEEIIQDHPVLLNRAPTLHRLGIQAFEPVLVEGKAIRIHPLVCAAFNADFDGDQMAVHVPLSFESQIEARLLMISSNNVLKPSDGRPVAEPSQDMVLGCYFLTKEPADFEQPEVKARAPRLASLAELDMGLATKRLAYHSPVHHWSQPPGEWVYTTAGRVIFNSILPEGLRREQGYQNQVMRKKDLSELVFESYRRAGLSSTVQFLDLLKEFGFRYATMGGVSIGVEDLEIPAEKASLLHDAEARVERFQRAYATGQITFGERYNKVIDAWTHANNDIADAMVKTMQRSKGGFNPVFMMFDSGSRGSRDQIRQLAGMRGLMAKPQKKLTGGIGEIIESPIKSNFREGLSVLEYFISTHGARKGLADTALKTADAGYLTRRLVDVAQDVTITEEDCGTILGLEMSALKEGEDIIEPLRERLVGCVALDEVTDPHELDEDERPKVLVEAGKLIDEETAQAIEDAGIKSVRIPSVLTCEAKRGVCRMCYGRNLATMDMVDLGEAVGILAAQSIGEPGTQLTLRTFHIGGTAARIAEQTVRKTKVEGVIEYGDRLIFVETPEKQKIVTSYEGELILKAPSHGESGAKISLHSRFHLPLGATLMVADGAKVGRDSGLFTGDPHTNPIMTDVGGVVRFVDIVEDETVREELDELTGRRQRVIIEDREKKLHPHIEIIQKKGDKEKRLRDFVIPEGAQLTVDDGQEVYAGLVLAKVSREAYKTRDITGGLPRVAELFEARRPKDPATISEVDGTVRFGDIKRGKREIYVHPEEGEPQLYEVPAGKHLRVHEGDRVRAGDRLTEGPVNPHDILRIKGPRAVQEYLLNEVQEVYRLQGVKINDKHIGVIVRQMLQKVKVVDPGDTEFLEGEHVDKLTFREINERAVKKDGKPATSEPLLLGITKASLTTQSFISAASFQETTRVLTDAAIRGARDDLLGLKENIIIGHLIPAGTGIYRYHEIEIEPPEGFQPPPPPVEPTPGVVPSPFPEEVEAD